MAGNQVGDSAAPRAPRGFDEAPPLIQAVIRAYAAFNARDLEIAVPPLDEARACTTPDRLRARMRRLLAAFPDLQVSHLRAYDLKDGRVGVRYVVGGTNAGALSDDVRATSRRISTEVMDVLEFDEAGRLVGGRRVVDLTAIDRQLGLRDV